jgi:uncharacterized membrane protein HdeD (DUF308 family)
MLQGSAGIILGFMLLIEPGATFVALTTILGFYWLIMGLLTLVQVFVDRSVPQIWSFLTGIVGILAGLFVLRHPLIAALTVPTVLVVILGIQGLAMGVLEIVGGFTGGGIGSFILGVINVLVGLLLLGSPVAVALAVPLVFGLLLLIQGGRFNYFGVTRWPLSKEPRNIRDHISNLNVSVLFHRVGVELHGLAIHGDTTMTEEA